MESTPTVLTIQGVPVAEIMPANNDRRTFDPKELQALAGSIREHGLVQPITVRPLLAGFELVAGERRWRAHQLLGAETIPAIVRDDLSDWEAAGIMLVENTSRVDLSPAEEARAYRRCIDEFAATVEDVAAAAGVTPQRVKVRLDLLALRPEVLELVHVGQLSTGMAWELTKLDHDRQLIGLKALQGGAGWDDLHSLCGRLLADQQQEAMFDAANFLQNEEYVIGAQAGLKRASRRRLVELLAAAVDRVDGELAQAIGAALAAEPQAFTKTEVAA